MSRTAVIGFLDDLAKAVFEGARELTIENVANFKRRLLSAAQTYQKVDVGQLDADVARVELKALFDAEDEIDAEVDAIIQKRKLDASKKAT